MNKAGCIMRLDDAIKALLDGKEIEGLKLIQNGQVLAVRGLGVLLDGWEEKRILISKSEFQTAFINAKYTASEKLDNMDELLMKELGFK
jgi:hypothetical protein